ncbi:MAG: hypothetical protein GXP29_00905 [Planctomycetes bacterium]|nr:hypothetical protein [Planctomycetota bacterium]
MLKTTSEDQQARTGTATSDSGATDSGSAANGAVEQQNPQLEVENRLDDLFQQHEKKIHQEASMDQPLEELSPIDALRRLFVDELIPVTNELREKYAANGLKLQMNAGNFLDGGREIVVEIQFAGIAMRYDGTVTTGAIAFQQTRFDEGDRSGLTASGAALRTRDLDGMKFRKFLCDRIGRLVQQASKRQR